MSNALVALHLQTICQLIGPGNSNSENASLALNTSLPTQTTSLIDGFTAFPDIGVAYKYFSSSLPWNEARKKCMTYGGNLAIIDSYKKMRYAMSIKTRVIEHVHVGIHRMFDDTEWISVKTSLPPALIPWDLEKNEQESNYKCLVMWYDGRGLTAGACFMSRNFICEIPLLDN